MGNKPKYSLIALSEAAWPIINAANHHSHMDKIEPIVVRPCILDIINLKHTVWWRAVNVNMSHASNREEKDTSWVE